MDIIDWPSSTDPTLVLIKSRFGLSDPVRELKSRTCYILLKSKKDSNDQESIQSSTTPDQGYHMGK